MAEYVEKEKVEGIYAPTGEEIKFNKVWSGHEFTDQEAAALLAGEVIEFDAVSKKGKDYKARGKLKQSEFNGHEFWGFQLELDESLPKAFCQHEFTDEEREKLENGEEIFIDDFVSKKGTTFGASIKFIEGKFDLNFD